MLVASGAAAGASRALQRPPAQRAEATFSEADAEVVLNDIAPAFRFAPGRCACRAALACSSCVVSAKALEVSLTRHAVVAPSFGPRALSFASDADEMLLRAESSMRCERTVVDFHTAIRTVAGSLLRDESVQRAMLANEELRSLLRQFAEEGMALPPPQATLLVVAEAQAQERPPEAGGVVDEWRAALAAAAHEAREVRLAAGAALQRFLSDAVARIKATFCPSIGVDAPACVALSLSVDAPHQHVRTSLRVVTARGAGDEPGSAAAQLQKACFGGAADADDDAPPPLSPLLEAALMLAAAALTVLVLLRGRGISVRDARVAVRAAAAAAAGRA